MESASVYQCWTLHAGHKRMVALCLGCQFSEKRTRVKHVGYFGIRCYLEEQPRQRDQMAIEYDIQVSNILGHQIVWLRYLLPRTQQYPYTQS
ncbi:uncharacterized protein N7518_002461 [Penicillium psychrosexuale]|uniref:uncharacterized protein n=1 Tax=Penicillium psychrosexuale TaxID=1002107 RepID=UPI00254596F5|nr:uncharacterized protein N7518_002461 [Penicillium psychrosexuale]KAJ5800393.1 hypothetical protein N7518_002461 [Penicillium psychrosexuale]